MRIKLLILLLSIALVPFSNAQKLKGDKNVTLEHRELDDFTSVVIKNNLKVFLEESPDSKVRVETDENLQTAVETRVVNDVLEVYLSQSIRSKKALNIYIGISDQVQKIEINDNANVFGKEDIHTGAIELITEDNSSLEMKLVSSDVTLTGKDRSDMKLTIKAENTIGVNLERNANVFIQCSAYKVDAKLADSSTLKPIGNCQELIVDANTNVSMKGKDLLTEYAAVVAIDRSNVFVNVAKELIISAENMAEIYVYDNPKIFIEKFSDKSSLYKK